MHFSSITSTESTPSTLAGRMAPVGQAETVEGTSHWAFSWSCLITGARRWTPRMAMSEQCTAPHMFRQQAKAMRSLAGSLAEPSKYGKSSSIRALTTPEASVAAEWQWTQPWVWTTLVIPEPIPPTG